MATAPPRQSTVPRILALVYRHLRSTRSNLHNGQFSTKHVQFIFGWIAWPVLVPETTGDDEDDARRKIGHGGGYGWGRHLHAVQHQRLEPSHPGSNNQHVEERTL